MNNETIKRYDVTIKLRGDHVYDLYLDGKWVASRGSFDNILDETVKAIRKKEFDGVFDSFNNLIACPECDGYGFINHSIGGKAWSEGCKKCNHKGYVFKDEV